MHRPRFLSAPPQQGPQRNPHSTKDRALDSIQGSGSLISSDESIPQRSPSGPPGLLDAYSHCMDVRRSEGSGEIVLFPFVHRIARPERDERCEVRHGISAVRVSRLRTAVSTTEYSRYIRYRNRRSVHARSEPARTRGLARLSRFLPDHKKFLTACPLPKRGSRAETAVRNILITAELLERRRESRPYTASQKIDVNEERVVDA